MPISMSSSLNGAKGSNLEADIEADMDMVRSSFTIKHYNQTAGLSIFDKIGTVSIVRLVIRIHCEVSSMNCFRAYTGSKKSCLLASDNQCILWTSMF